MWYSTVSLTKRHGNTVVRYYEAVTAKELTDFSGELARIANSRWMRASAIVTSIKPPDVTFEPIPRDIEGLINQTALS